VGLIGVAGGGSQSTQGDGGPLGVGETEESLQATDPLQRTGADAGLVDEEAAQVPPAQADFIGNSGHVDRIREAQTSHRVSDPPVHHTAAEL
jgi:hypothetical protein